VQPPGAAVSGVLVKFSARVLVHIEVLRNVGSDLYSWPMTETAVSPDPGLVRALRALSNPMRLQLLSWLREPERHFSLEGAIADPVEVGVCVSHIQAKAGLAQSTVSAYMAELQRAGLVQATRVGKWTHYKRDEQRIAQLVAVLGQTL
jgi:DNA-binding transcriptional ArsR family regulator